MTLEDQSSSPQISWISQEVLQNISNEIELGFVVQEILLGGQLHQLRLGIPYGICNLIKRHMPTNQVFILPQLSYQFKGENGVAKIVLGAKNNVREIGSIEIPNGANAKTTYSISLDTRRQIEGIIRMGHKLQNTESIRRIPKNLNRFKGQNSLLRYSDADGNVYFLWAPKINNRKMNNPQSDSHKSIIGLYKEENGVIKYYQVINSFQETGKLPKKAYLHVIEGESFDNFVFLKLLKEELIVDYEIGTIATSGSVISLDVDSLMKVGEKPNEYKCSLENINIA